MVMLSLKAMLRSTVEVDMSLERPKLCESHPVKALIILPFQQEHPGEDILPAGGLRSWLVAHDLVAYAA